MIVTYVKTFKLQKHYIIYSLTFISHFLLRSPCSVDEGNTAHKHMSDYEENITAEFLIYKNVSRDNFQ